MNIRTIIAPIVALVFVCLQLFLGIEVPESIQEELMLNICNLVAVVGVIYGIFTNHKTK